MSEPVICADQTIQDGLVLRWRRSTEGPAILSASRNCVMIRGDVMVNEDLLVWMDAAMSACELLRDGRRDEAKAMATHRWSKTFGGDLVPIEPAAISGMERAGNGDAP